MGLDRRTFLQGAGLAFLATGMSAVGGDRLTPLGIASHFQALAQSKRRKFALLVGIDRYGKADALQGCKTDVELQQELLIHRFGFNPRDILVLTDERGTRENIETAFAEYLRPQAKASDIIVFHFSGYGNQVSVPLPSIDTENRASAALGIKTDGKAETVLANCLLTAGDRLGEAGILEETLFSWARSLPTKNLTMVLDTSYAGDEKSLHGNGRSRSQPPANFSALIAQPEQGLESLAKFEQKSRVPGILLQAAREGEDAIEIVWDEFSAGLLTYTLVQALWQANSPTTIQAIFSHSVAQMQGIGSQRPQKLGKKASDPSIPAYFTQPESLVSAEGVITTVESNGSTVSLHLAGLPITVLQNYGTNSQLRAGEADNAIALQVVSRSGFTVKAERIDNERNKEKSLIPGQLVRESLRVLPRNLGLVVALDAKLSRIERVDATSAFANISTVSAVVSAGEASADCLFSRAHSSLAVVTEAIDSKQTAPQGYGLFSSGFVSLPNTLGKGDEAIKAAVERLAPKFNTLLAVKLWQAIVNEASSQLAVSASLQAVDPQLSPKIERVTRGFKTQKPTTNRFEKAFPQFPSGKSIQFEIENAGDRPLYLALVGVKTTGIPLILYSASNDTDVELRDIVIEPGSILSLPKSTSTLNDFTATTPGIAETIVICSRSPFGNLAKLLATLPNPHGQGDRLIEVEQPLKVALALLQDLNDASGINSSDDDYALDVKAWAALRFVYQVI